MCSREAGVGVPLARNETASYGNISRTEKAAAVNSRGLSDVAVRLAKLGEATDLTTVINNASRPSRVDLVTEDGLDRVTADGNQGLGDSSKCVDWPTVLCILIVIPYYSTLSHVCVVNTHTGCM